MRLRFKTHTLFCLAAACSVGSAAERVEFIPPAGSYSESPVPLGGEDCDHSDGPRLAFQPRATLRTVYGDTDLEDAGLAHGGHDPVHKGFSIPDLSLGMDILYGEHLGAFTEGIFSWNREDGWDAELEEAYMKFMNLPGGFELHAGILLVTVGTQNHSHTHSWNFVDAQLGNVRFLGDDGLAIEGAELTWSVPTHWDDRLMLALGNAVVREHEEENNGGVIAHGHADEAEMALWDRNLIAARYEATSWPGDTCRFIYGASYVQGDNFMGKTARLYGLDLTYNYYEDENHAKQFTWRNEAMLRRVHTDDGKFEEFAFDSTAIYRPAPEWEIGLRYDYLEGVKDPELPERHRVSPSVTRFFNLGSQTHANLRLQYNHDHSESRGTDNSVWLQFSIEWGGGDAHVH